VWYFKGLIPQSFLSDEELISEMILSEPEFPMTRPPTQDGPGPSTQRQIQRPIPFVPPLANDNDDTWDVPLGVLYPQAVTSSDLPVQPNNSNTISNSSADNTDGGAGGVRTTISTGVVRDGIHSGFSDALNRALQAVQNSSQRDGAGDQRGGNDRQSQDRSSSSSDYDCFCSQCLCCENFACWRDRDWVPFGCIVL